MDLEKELWEALDDIVNSDHDGDMRGPARDILLPLVRKAQAEVLAQAIQAHRGLHPVYGSTSVCYGGAGGQALTQHCAVVCPNSAHDAEQEAWYQVEKTYVEIRGAH